MMVTFKVDAQATAKVQGAEDQEKFPIVARVLGAGKDGSLCVQVLGEGSGPINAKISGDSSSPIALGPISVEPISIVPDLKVVAESFDIKGLISSMSKLADGLSVSVATQDDKPIALALGKIPVDLTISVYSPAQEQVLKVEIKGTVGEK